MTWVQVGDALLVVILLSFVAFLVAYASLAGWARTIMGRHVMAFMGGACLTVGVRVSRMVFGYWPGYEAMRVFCFVLVIVLLWWRIALVVRAQICARRDRNKIEERS